jgi:hypothetical protein
MREREREIERGEQPSNIGMTPPPVAQAFKLGPERVDPERGEQPH